MQENKNPLVTFVLLSYNQEKYIAEAVKAVLGQDYANLQIILSDDCSVDNTYNILEKLVAKYNGPHKIILNRTTKNLGVGSHVNEVFKKITGSFIVMGAGDDISSKKRVSILVDEWAKNNYKSCSIYSSYTSIDDEGLALRESQNNKRKISKISNRTYNVKEGVSGCTQAFSRDIIEKFGPYDNRIIHEDYILPFRAALIGDVIYIPTPLVQYRVLENSLSHTSKNYSLQRQKKILDYIRGNVAMNLQYLTDLNIIREENAIDNQNYKYYQEEIMKDYEKAVYKLDLYTGNFLKRIILYSSNYFKISDNNRIKNLAITLFSYEWLCKINSFYYNIKNIKFNK